MTAQTARGRDTSATSDDPPRTARRPLYPRLLGLRHLRLRDWQRLLLGDGSFLVALLLVLADLATAWTVLVLPVAVAVLVKLHDLAAGLLSAQRPRTERSRTDTPTAPVPQDRRRRRRRVR